MIKILNQTDCCGCTACASICTHEAITMKPDAMGFLYPEVDRSKCVDCGLCDKVCAFNDNYDKSLNLSKPIAYAARHKNMAEVATSRSGAAFIAISDWILTQGGIVYGAGYAEHFRIVHKRATTKKERNEFKGSKYVQSDMRGVLRQVKQDLRDGKIVLFSGTPCQCASVNSFVGKRLRENLYLCDIVCHGVPSPKFWDDYLFWQEKRLGEKVTSVNFRDKRFGWDDHIETLTTAHKRKSVNIYTHFFHLEYISRLSCYHCKYCNVTRPSDITIADFWGLDKIDASLNKDNKGYSLVLANTEKGRRVAEASSADMHMQEVELASSLQWNLQHPTPMKQGRQQFIDDYLGKGFEFVLHKYGNTDLKSRFKEKKWRIFKKIGYYKWKHRIKHLLRHC